MMMMMSFVLRTTTTSAPQNSVVVYVSHNLHRGVTDKIVVGVVKLVVVAAGNNKQRKQRSPLKRSFSLLLFSLLLNVVVLRAFLFSIHSVMSCVFCEQKNIFLFDSRQTRFFPLSLFIFHLEKRQFFFTRDGQMIFCAQSKNCTKITRTNTNRKELTPFK